VCSSLFKVMIEVLVLECFHCAKVKAVKTVNCTTIKGIFQYTSRALFVACMEWCIAYKQAPKKTHETEAKFLFTHSPGDRLGGAP